ncbi:MAG: hypothetical protein IKO68_13885 [Oscillospiraceae bacterium]|nr:hypothetical protein [Oscillospiraceae bacterium]
MASISISDLYRGEGPGEKYGGILNAVFHEIFTKGIPEGCSEQTWIELLTVKHTFLVAERMKTEGDVVSELSEAASPFCVIEKEAALCSGAQRTPHFPTRICSGAQCAPPEPSETRRGVAE